MHEQSMMIAVEKLSVDTSVMNERVAKDSDAMEEDVFFFGGDDEGDDSGSESSGSTCSLPAESESDDEFMGQVVFCPQSAFDEDEGVFVDLLLGRLRRRCSSGRCMHRE